MLIILSLLLFLAVQIPEDTVTLRELVAESEPDTVIHLVPRVYDLGDTGLVVDRNLTLVGTATMRAAAPFALRIENNAELTLIGVTVESLVTEEINPEAAIVVTEGSTLTATNVHISGGNRGIVNDGTVVLRHSRVDATLNDGIRSGDNGISTTAIYDSAVRSDNDFAIQHGNADPNLLAGPLLLDNVTILGSARGIFLHASEPALLSQVWIGGVGTGNSLEIYEDSSAAVQSVYILDGSPCVGTLVDSGGNYATNESCTVESIDEPEPVPEVPAVTFTVDDMLALDAEADATVTGMYGVWLLGYDTPVEIDCTEGCAAGDTFEIPLAEGDEAFTVAAVAGPGAVNVFVEEAEATPES